MAQRLPGEKINKGLRPLDIKERTIGEYIFSVQYMLACHYHKMILKKKFKRIVFIIAFFLVIISYFVCRWHIRFEIETTFVVVSKAFQQGNHLQIFEYMTPEYRAKHEVRDVIQFFDQHNNWFKLEDGWSLSLSWSFKEAWVYPFDEGFFDLWNGPEYQLLKIDGKWFFTGESNIYLN